jgi:hypothetical protein
MLNYAGVYDIERTDLDDTLGYKSDFFAIGQDKYYEEFTFELSKKINKNNKFVLSYLYQVYDRNKLEGKIGQRQVTAHLGVMEYTLKLSGTKSLRFDVEHLYTEQDRGNWAMALVEYTVAPHWSVALFDEWNYGNDKKDFRIHYFNGSLTYVAGGTRLMIGWARQRAGLLCVGGVCRFVPASNGVTLTISSRF